RPTDRIPPSPEWTPLTRAKSKLVPTPLKSTRLTTTLTVPASLFIKAVNVMPIPLGEATRSVDSILGLEDAEHRDTVRSSSTYMAHIDREKTMFVEWFDWLMEDPPAALSLLGPNHTADPDVYFQPGGPRLTLDVLKHFLTYRVSTMASRKAATVSQSTVLGNLLKLDYVILLQSGVSIDRKTRREATMYIRTTMTQRHKLDTTPPSRSFMLRAVYKQSMRTWLDSTFQLWTLRARLQGLAHESYMFATDKRVGSTLVQLNSSSSRSLTWGDMTLTVIADPDGGDNLWSVRFVPPNSKGDSGKDDHVELDTYPEVWDDAGFHYVLVAFMADALPDGWTVETLLDRASLAGQDNLSLSFAAVKSQEAVCIGPGQGDQKKDKGHSEWTGKSFGRFFSQLTEHARLHPRPTSHTLRRSGVVYGKIRGVGEDELARQLRHKSTAITTRHYTGQVSGIDPSSVILAVAADPDSVFMTHTQSVKVMPLMPELVRSEIMQDENLMERLDEYHKYSDSLIKTYPHGDVPAED
ncbi:hypothetical protein P7C73_g6152, partial [Tremellales sp. Uapishka_1]